MTARPVDVAPAGPVRLPESGLGHGWEARAVMGLTILLLSVGLVSLYSASSVLAMREGEPDTYFLVRQAAAAGGGFNGRRFPPAAVNGRRFSPAASLSG